MKEVVKVQNPLTIIAIFAGIAEVAGTTVLLGLPLEIQRIFVWFVVFFPFALVLAFFYILYKRHLVLYAPSDFANQEHFMQLIGDTHVKVNEVLSEGIEKARKSLDSPSDFSNESEFINILQDIQGKVGNVFESKVYSESKPLYELHDTKFGNAILVELSARPAGLTIAELSEMVGITRAATVRIVTGLQRDQKVSFNGTNVHIK